MKKRVVKCPYCKKRAEYVDSIAVYHKSYGMIYLCWPCKAWVGVHKHTDKPLGRIADRKLRLWKRRAHEVFDLLWKTGGMGRTKAYSYMRKIMSMNKSEAHIGKFDVDQCKKLVGLLTHTNNS